MALINELLDEAAQRCQQLSEDSDRTLALLQEVLAGAEEVAATVEAETTQTRDHLADLTTELDEAESTLSSTAGEAGTALEGLEGRAEEVRNTVGALLARVRSALGELSSRQRDLSSRLDQQGGAADQEMEQALDRARELQTLLSGELEKASQAIEGFTEALEAEREEWDARRTSLLEALNALEEGVRAKTEAYASEIADLLDHQRVDVLVQRLANEMLIDSHNQAVDELGLHYEDELPPAAEEACTRLRTAVADLKQLCVEHQQVLRGKWTEIAAKAEQALQTAQSIQPVLQDASRLTC